MPSPIWVAKLLISDATAAKIRSRHGVDPQEVRDAVVCRTGLRFGWHDHRDRGRRAIVETEIRERPALVVLYPAGDDVYHLGSAYFLR